MPNRILRDWTDSRNMDKLSWQEEVMFTRLIMKADDYGKYHADPQLLKSLLFPRKDGIRSNDITRWMQSLEKAGLILTYRINGDFFLQIVNFKQRLRIMKSLFPDPPENERQAFDIPMTDIRPLETKRNEDETETKRKEGFCAPTILDVIDYFLENDFSKELAERAFKHYDVAGWKDTTGKPVKNWKQKMHSVWFKPENKNGSNSGKETEERIGRLSRSKAESFANERSDPGSI